MKVQLHAMVMQAAAMRKRVQGAMHVVGKVIEATDGHHD